MALQTGKDQRTNGVEKMSNFTFLGKYWPRMPEIGQAAERLLYGDANACVVKLGMLAECIVSEMIFGEKLTVSESSNHADRVRLLRHAGMLPTKVDNILYALKKARNDAVHEGLTSADKAETLLRMAFHLCVWFMGVYGDWSFEAPEFVLPLPPENGANPADIPTESDDHLSGPAEEMERTQPPAEAFSSEDRRQRGETVIAEMRLTPEEEQYLIGEQIHLDIDLLPAVNYALQQNGIHVIQSITIENHSEKPLEQIDLRITSSPEFSLPYTRHIECVNAKGSLCLRDVPLLLDAEFLAGLTDQISAQLHVSLTYEETVMCSENVEVKVLSFDEWQGYTLYPEILASFVTPNHPEVTRIIAKAACFLGEWTGDPSLDAYQSKDPNRVLAQAAAVYAALQSENIIYAVPPASFGRIGQRVRLCDAVIQQKLGTCLDLTLLYASCLEAMGLHALLIQQSRHIFAGIWLEELSFPEAVQDDVSLITKRLADGVNEIAIVECTAFVAGKNMSFDLARKAAEAEISDTSILEGIIDVFRTRLSGITPLPLRIQREDGWHIDTSGMTQTISAAPKSVLGALDVDPLQKEENVTKKTQWERKLLDLGLRNTLINMRLSSTMLPIMVSSLDELEDALSGGDDFSILPRPEDWQLSKTSIGLHNLHELGGYEAIIKAEFKNKRLRTTYTESEFSSTIKGLYRSARSAMEENGANTLYLALGLLKWYENPRSQKPRYAPIVLLPIEMVRKSVAQGYVVRLRDDEPQMNITILEKMKQDFGLVVNGLDPLPLDDHGIDIRRVLTILRKAIMSEKRWDVLESACLGIFSFSQFVMWNDIRNRSEDLEQNKIVRSLMDGKLAWDAKDMEIGDTVSEEDVLLPIPADASQLFAIEQATKGESFILHGPPGTGKSQTITALIANALAHEKSVLFVAEKMAALEVVQKRLAAIGIAPFCLELHSNKSKKRDVLEQLKEATEVTKGTTPEAYAIKADQIAALRGELDEYAHLLHTKHSCGLSLFEIVNRYEEVKDAPDLRAFPFEYAEKTSASDMDAQVRVIERLVVAARAIGHPHHHPLGRIACRQYSQRIRFALDANLDAYRRALREAQETGAELAHTFSMNPPGPYSDFANLSGIAKEMVFWLGVPTEWAKEPSIGKLMDDVCEMARHYLLANDIAADLLTRWQESFLSVDAKKVLGELNENDAKWILGRFLGENRIFRSLASHMIRPVNKADLRGEVEKLLKYQLEKAYADKLYQRCGKGLDVTDRDNSKAWQRTMDLAQQGKESAERLAISQADHIRLAYGGNPAHEKALRDYIAAWGNLSAIKDALYGLLDLRPSAEERDWGQSELDLCDGIEGNAEQLKEWITFNLVAEETRNLGLDGVVDAYLDGLDHDDVLPAFKKAAYQNMAMYIIDRNAALNSFSGTVFNEKIEQFKRLDQELRTLTRQEIYCRLASRIPNFSREAAQSSELGILQRAIRSGGRGISIRKLFEQIPELLPRLCPCMLMSPISAAQYLDPKRKPFDLVVFDEASQLPTCKAVGALARGENAIIVGDPKQMPPTSFFTRNTIDEDNLDIEDLESILEDCLAINMPDTHLLWHYRSRHESLIAFSNSQFYERKLYTFPSVNERDAKVTLQHVDGVFTRGTSRQNRAEAEAVIEELKRRCHDPKRSEKSVGVVTFNVSQQDLIEDLLTEACILDSELEHWAYESPEPIFIKNLENVQGDERDVILFSIGYGPDENGKVYMNFGPLNREGGWRRLNVAVSRARFEMKVFSTLTPDQIDLTKTSARGVAALKLFLEYAAGGELPTEESDMQANTHGSMGVVHSICEALAENGYETDCTVGHSEFKIDIGVINPGNPNEYLLGILLDGENYGKAKTTRDREIAQIKVLNDLGWRVIRVFTMDWWDNSKKELDRILKAIKDAESAAPEDPTAEGEETRSAVLPVQIQKSVSEEKPPVGLTDASEKTEGKSGILNMEPAYYSATPLTNPSVSSDQFVSSFYDSDILHTLQAVIEHEAPICESLLIRRVIQSFGISRSGARIQAKLQKLLYKLCVPYTKLGEEKVYWASDQDPASYVDFRVNGEGDGKRETKEVPPEEVRNAICHVLEEQISLPDDDLIKESAKVLGYPRMGKGILSLMESGIALAQHQGRIQKNINDRWILS